MLVRRIIPAATRTRTAPPAGKGSTVSYAAYAATTVGLALPGFHAQPELERRHERASTLGSLDLRQPEPRQRLNS